MIENLKDIFARYTIEAPEQFSHTVAIRDDGELIGFAPHFKQLVEGYNIEEDVIEVSMAEGKSWLAENLDVAGVRLGRDLNLDEDDGTEVAKIAFNIVALRSGVDNTDEKHLFLHELGHIFKSYKDNGLNESYADIFAALAYAKETGSVDLELKDMIYSRANVLCFGEASSDQIRYYTSNGCLVAKRIAEEINIKEISVKDIAELSEIIVDNFALSEAKIRGLVDHFVDCGEGNFKDIKLKEISEAMLASYDKEVLRAGYQMLLTEGSKDALNMADDSVKLAYANKFKKLKQRSEQIGFHLNPIDENEQGARAIKDFVEARPYLIKQEPHLSNDAKPALKPS